MAGIAAAAADAETAVGAAAENAGSKISGAVEDAQSEISGIIDNVKDKVGETEEVVSKLEEAVGEVKENADGVIAGALEAANSTLAAAEENTSSAIDEAAGEDLADSAAAEPEEETADNGVMSYEDYAAADLDTQVCVETYVQAKQSWWDNTVTVYAQDPDGAIFIYNMACSEEDYEKLTEGQKIRVTGYKSEWAGEVEIVDAEFELIEDAEPFVASEEDVTELLGTDELEEKMNAKVAFKGLTVEASEDADGNEAAFLYNYDGSGEPGSDLYFKASVGGETYTFTVESYLCGEDTDVYKAVEGLQIGDVIDMEGFLYWYEGANPHITSVTPAEAEDAAAETEEAVSEAEEAI